MFPRALGLPRDPVVAAVQALDALRAGRTTSISLGKVNGRRFCFSAGIGFDAEAVRRIDSRGRDREGRRAGNLTFAATVIGIVFEKRLRMPPQLEIEDFGRAAFVFVANGRPYTYMGAVPVNVAGRADFAGGSTSSLRARSPRALVPRLAFRGFQGRLDGDPGVLTGHDLDAFHVRCDVATAAAGRRRGSRRCHRGQLLGRARRARRAGLSRGLRPPRSRAPSGRG